MPSLAETLMNSTLGWGGEERVTYPTPDFSEPDLRKALMEVLPLKLKSAGMACDAEHVSALVFEARNDISSRSKKVRVICKGKVIITEEEVDSMMRHLAEKKQWDKGMKKAKPVTGFAAFAAGDKKLNLLGPEEPDDPFEGHYADDAPPEPPLLMIPRFDGDYERLANEFAGRALRACKLLYADTSEDFSKFTVVRHVPSLDIEIFLGPVTRTGPNKPVLSVEQVRVFCNGEGVDMPCLYSALCDVLQANVKDDRSDMHGPPPTGEVIVTIKKKKRRLG